jgi:hypothetical protein
MEFTKATRNGIIKTYGLKFIIEKKSAKVWMKDDYDEIY